jgi:hypothetical protein
MSYTIAVTVKDGKAAVDESATTPAETLADGRYVINGHVPSPGTWQAETVQVTRYQPDGSIVIQASGTHFKPPQDAG